MCFSAVLCVAIHWLRREVAGRKCAGPNVSNPRHSTGVGCCDLLAAPTQEPGIFRPRHEGCGGWLRCEQTLHDHGIGRHELELTRHRVPAAFCSGLGEMNSALSNQRDNPRKLEKAAINTNAHRPPPREVDGWSGGSTANSDRQ